MRKAVAIVALLGCLSTNALANDDPPPTVFGDDAPIPADPPAEPPANDATEAAPIASSPPPVMVPPDPSARTPAIVFTAISLGLVAATVGIYYHREGLANVNGVGNITTCDFACQEERDRNRAQIEREKKMYIGTAIAAVVTGGVAAYFWTKATEKTFKRPTQLTFHADGQGAALGLSGRF